MSGGGGLSQAQRDHERLQAAREAACNVCGEAVGPAPTVCPSCDTPYHFDCWEYSGGCGVYACTSQARRPPNPQAPLLPGKLGMPHKKAGSHAGYLWAPPGAVLTVFASEAVAVPLIFFGNPSGYLFLGVMVLALLYIAFSSEHHYLDFDRGKITRAKALFGVDFVEVDRAELADFELLSLRPVLEKGARRTIPPAPPKAYEMVARYPDARAPFVLSPPLAVGSEVLATAVDLLGRIRASQAFRVRLPPSLAPVLPAGGEGRDGKSGAGAFDSGSEESAAV